MTVTFCGHRQIEDHDAVERWLAQCIEKLILEGADCFYLGGHGAFDRMAARILKQFKKRYPYIRLVHVLAYRMQNLETWLYDSFEYPLFESESRSYSIIRRNQWMVRQSDAVVAYVLYGWGGAAKTLSYAQTKKRRILRYPAVD